MAAHPADSIVLSFDQGTLVVRLNGHALPEGADLPLVYDHRIDALRGEGCCYRKVVEALVEHKMRFVDHARSWATLPEFERLPFDPYPHQAEALEAWKKGGRAGVVVMPTGSGKTVLAEMVMAECRRPTMVVVPTLDLLAQWVSSVEASLHVTAGVVGGGEYRVEPITVITYDSAVRHIEHLGNKFGLIVFDECHHLPAAIYSNIARMAIAPFRLGLTATPERADGGEEILFRLVGPIVYTSRVSALAGKVLSPYRTKRILVQLTPKEEEEYLKARETYLSFCREKGLELASPKGWGNFLREVSRSRAGREVFKAYLKQKHIPLKSESKMLVLSTLLAKHKGDRIIIFTHVNELAYAISRRFLIPVITHQTPPRERVEILSRFGSGDYPAVVTSKVLNEGVDVPEANVGIVLSGSGSVREHVQRLGRILRRREGKEAILYELVADDTHEKWMSIRRRKHEAYSRRR